jgi:hypothetical protein
MTSPPPDFRLAPQTYDPAIPVAAITEHPGNPNEGNESLIMESLAVHGFFGAIGVQRSTGRIIWGNHRYRDARKLGAAALPGFWLDVDDDQAAKIMAVENEATRQGRNNEAKLLALLRPLSNLAGTGYTDAKLETMLARWEQPLPYADGREGETSWNDGDAGQGRPGYGGDGASLASRGLREIVLVLPNAAGDELVAAVKQLRAAWGDLALGDVLLRCAVQAVAALPAGEIE